VTATRHISGRVKSPKQLQWYPLQIISYFMR